MFEEVRGKVQLRAIKVKETTNCSYLTCCILNSLVGWLSYQLSSIIAAIFWQEGWPAGCGRFTWSGLNISLSFWPPGLSRLRRYMQYSCWLCSLFLVSQLWDGKPYSPAGQWSVKSSPCHSNVWSHPGGGRRRGSGPLLYEDVRILIDCTIDSWLSAGPAPEVWGVSWLREEAACFLIVTRDQQVSILPARVPCRSPKLHRTGLETELDC